MQWVYLALAVMAEVVATSALKASKSFTVLGPSLVVFVGYCVAFYLLALALEKIPLGIAYALWSALGLAIVAVIGVFWFGERLDLPAIVGMLLIVSGVVTINLFSQTVAH